MINREKMDFLLFSSKYMHGCLHDIQTQSIVIIPSAIYGRKTYVDMVI